MRQRSLFDTDAAQTSSPRRDLRRPAELQTPDKMSGGPTAGTAAPRPAIFILSPRREGRGQGEGCATSLVPTRPPRFVRSVLVPISGVWLLGFCRRLYHYRLFIEVLFLDHIVARADSFTRTFYFLALQDQRRPGANHLNYKTIGGLGESLGQIVQGSHLPAIYFVDNAGPIRSEISVSWIRKNIR